MFSVKFDLHHKGFGLTQFKRMALQPTSLLSLHPESDLCKPVHGSKTQEELADRAELSKGFISQVENNLTSPSIATLTDILQCLGTDLKDFFNDTKDEQIVFSKEDYFEKNDSELKNSIQWIIPNAQKNSTVSGSRKFGQSCC